MEAKSIPQVVMEHFPLANREILKERRESSWDRITSQQKSLFYQ